MDCRERPWSDLPQELLSTIANYLTSNPNILDTLSFRSVCHSWRSSCPPFSQLSILSSVLPLLVDRPPSPFLPPLPHYSTDSNLSVTVIYALHRPEGASWIPGTWIVFVDEFEPGKVKIRKPFLKGSYSMSKFFPKCLNLFDFDVHELARFYNLSYCCHYDQYDGRLLTNLDKPQFHSEDVLKVVLLPNGSAAIALFKGGKLGLMKIGIYEEEWEGLHDGKGFRFDDIVDYKGRILGVDRRGRVYEISHSPSKIKPIVRSISDGDGRRNRLVESLDLLYLVVRCNDCGETNGTATFKVYELNEKGRKWVEINNSIDDRVFFFGIVFSFSASAQELSFKKSCILFEQQSFQSYNGEVDDKAVFFNSWTDYFNIGVYHLDSPTHVGAIGSYPFYSDALWPPPNWIWRINTLVRLRTVDTAVDKILGRIIPENLEAKFQDLKIEGALGACVDYQLYCSSFRKISHIIKEALNDANLVERNLIMNISMCMFNQTKRLEELSQAASPMAEERRDCYDKLQRASWDLSCVLRKQNDMIFMYENQVTVFGEYASYYYSLFNC